ncbi:unnamed protein product [Callosobruchus maculatus]|uniref:Uncharacterized protein n=1 Tax=Callosobruchus maculatus TaxID=64391 RepID=A0A653BUR6_CALMS|nr:unnamed protein product [Callosobruchus maculatus]
MTDPIPIINESIRRESRSIDSESNIPSATDFSAFCPLLLTVDL